MWGCMTEYDVDLPKSQVNYFLKCNFPMTGWSVGRSVIISVKGGKLNFHGCRTQPGLA